MNGQERCFFSSENQAAGPEALRRMVRRLPALRRLNVSENELQLVAELLSFTSLTKDDDIDLFFLVVAGLLAARSRGSTRLALEDEEHFDFVEFRKRLHADKKDESQTPVARAIEAFLKRSELSDVIALESDPEKALASNKPLIFDGHHLSCERDLALEVHLAKMIAERLQQPDLEKTVAVEVSEDGRTDLTEQQYEAVRSALRRPLFCISGGPGTGKTTLVAALLAEASARGLTPADLALAAPTGKAAYRLGQALREQGSHLATGSPSTETELPTASTLHQLLGFDPRQDRFRRHRGHPIEAKLVIVDEASMIDLKSMERLLQALRPDAQLVLIGDADQLPAVDAGAVFSDLCHRDGIRLTENFRQAKEDDAGRRILAVAEAIRNGRAEAFLAAADDTNEAPGLRRRARLSEILGQGPEHVELKNASEFSALLDQWFDERLRLIADFPELASFDWPDDPERDDERRRLLLRRHEEHRIIAATRVLPQGTEAMNRRLRLRLARELGLSGGLPFLCGEPVVMTRNDPRRRLFNGDQGVALPRRGARDAGSLEIVFEREGRLIAFSPAALSGRCESAFATTVHKSQGSEFADLLFVLPAKDTVTPSRELIYTAVTRARRSVLIAGSLEVLRDAVLSQDRRDGALAACLDRELALPS